MRNDSQGIRAGVGHGSGTPTAKPRRVPLPPFLASSAVAAVALLLSGCGFNDVLLNGGNAAAGSTVQSIPPSKAEVDAGAAAAPAPAPAPVSAAVETSAPSDTSTVVGRKVVELRADLERIKNNLAHRKEDAQQVRLKLEQDSFAYFSLLGQIDSHLQVGTTPGNPKIMAQWNSATVQLDHLSQDAGQLSKISTEAASDSSLASYLVNATRAAFALQGAVDEDHRNLHQIETDANATMVGIDALLTSLSEEISRQSTILANERNNLDTLAVAIRNGQLYGPSLASRAFDGSAGTAVSAAPRRGVHTSALPEPGQRPLVVIRFDRPDVPYQESLYNAVNRALERRPEARFEIVAVAPGSSNPAEATVGANASKQNAESVRQSLVNMGLPADRMSLSATSSRDVQGGEVRVYVR